MNNLNDTSGERGGGSLERMVRPRPRTFQHFPETSLCPICGTNDDGETVLVQIAGTAKDGIAEAKPMHLGCAVAKQWDEGMAIALTWPNAELCHRSEPVATLKPKQG